MFRPLVIFLLCWSYLPALQAQLPSHFPFYDEVVDYVVEKATCHVCVSNRMKLNILKDTDGFWLTVHAYQNNKGWTTNNKQLIWSEEEGFEKEIFIEGDCFAQILNPYDFKTPPKSEKYRLIDEYNINRFFGDEHWSNNTINYYRKYTPETYEDYYSLGRAYSHKHTQYVLEHGVEHILEKEPSIVEDILKDGEKAISCFKKVWELQPDYNTIVGNIYNKYSNEVITLHMQIAFLGLKEKALAVVEGKDLYTAATLAFAKNSLLSCPTNGILITYGDNDTYPLLYLQQAKKIRPDVLVVNASLLNLDLYINHLKDKNYYKDNYLEIDLESHAYTANNNEYLLLRAEKEEVWPIKKLVQLLESEGKPNKTAPTKSFSLLPQEEEAVVFKSEQPYLIRSSLLLLAILDKNYPTRPVLFSSSYGFSNKNIAGHTGVKEYIHVQGINHQFTEEKKGELLTKKNALKNYYIFTKQFEWPVFEKIEEEDFPAFNSLVTTHKTLIKSLIEHEEIEKAEKVSNLYYSYFSKIIHELSLYQQSELIQTYHQLGQKDKTAPLLATMFTYLMEEEELSKMDIFFIEEGLFNSLEKVVKELENLELIKQYKQLKITFKTLYPSIKK